MPTLQKLFLKYRHHLVQKCGESSESLLNQVFSFTLPLQPFRTSLSSGRLDFFLQLLTICGHLQSSIMCGDLSDVCSFKLVRYPKASQQCSHNQLSHPKIC